MTLAFLQCTTLLSPWTYKVDTLIRIMLHIQSSLHNLICTFYMHNLIESIIFIISQHNYCVHDLPKERNYYIDRKCESVHNKF